MSYSERIQKILEEKSIREGDIIKVDSVEGILMPRIFGDEDTLIIKLKNGYNIGIKNFENIEKLGTYEKKTQKPMEISQRKDLPKVRFIGTGGTISSRVDYVTGGVTSSFSPNEILFEVPEILDIANIDAVEVFKTYSENMTPDHWIKISEKVYESMDEGDGIVIFHGTDTMHYTSAALSFMIHNPEKSVVLVGAQRSSDRPSSDTVLNVICATRLALTNLPAIMICMHESVNDDRCVGILGTRARKFHSSRRDAFKSVNAEPVAFVYPDHVILNYTISRKGKMKYVPGFEKKTALVWFYPGMSPELLDVLVDKGYRGIVLAGTGLGHVGEYLFKSVERAIDSGVFVCMTTQTIYGRTNPYVYETGRKLERMGVVYLQDMFPEVAYVKLGWVLSQKDGRKEVIELMLTNIAGELSERSLL